MENWIKNLAIKAIHICRLTREAAGNHRQDMSLPVLERLQNEGYNQVQWDSGNSTHSVCRDLNRQVWDIDSFTSGLNFEAPLFEKSHPGDSNCTLIVSGPNLPDVQVDSYGETDFNIGTNRPVKAPPAPKVVQKVLAPKPAPKVVEKPVAPEKIVRHVPKEVHKQMKDPFEKQKLTPEEYADWLSTSEKENVEEEEEPIPAPLPKKELTDEEWDEIRDFNKETSLKSPAKWIYGLFKGN